MGCQSGFKFPFSGGTCADFDDVFVRKDFFSEGGLWLWGLSSFGKLGDNSIACRSSPVQTVSGGTNWKQVSSGNNTTAAVKTDGSLWLWGTGAGGTLGNNLAVAYRSSPVQTVSGGTNWKQICMGSDKASAIKTDGSLWTWGANYAGGHGDNSTTYRSSPVQTVSGGTNWRQVASGGSSSAAIKTDGTLWLWGGRVRGKLGDNSYIFRSSPVQTVSGGTNWQQVSMGTEFTAAVKTDGTLWLWGSNLFFQLGNPSTTNSQSSPIQTVSGGTNWKQVSAGGQHTAAIKTDGTLWVWGANASGQLGVNYTTTVGTPSQTVSGGTNWKQVSAAVPGAHTAAIKTDGTLWVWGCATYGRLGTNSTVSQSSPVQTVSGGTNWQNINASYTTAVIRQDCW